MVVIDFSSVIHRMVSGSLESLVHVYSPNHQAKIGMNLHCNYKKIGEISHIMDDDSFTFTIDYGVKYEEISNLMEFPTAKLTKATKLDHKYPLSAYVKVFNNVFFNNINNLHSKFGSTFGKMVFCLDKPTDKGYWRKRFLPTYKGTRKATRAKSNIDFTSLFEYINNTILPQFGKLTPITIAEYPRAEGDDVISTLVNEYKGSEKMLIISEDKDLKALVTDNVVFYRPMLNRYAEKLNDVEREDYIRLHSIIGDDSDNVLNATLDTKYHPDFLKWLNAKLKLDIGEYDITSITDVINLYRPKMKVLFKEYYSNTNDQTPISQYYFDEVVNSEEFTNIYKDHNDYHPIGLYSNTNEVYYDFIKDKHPTKYEDTINGDWGQISTKVFKHYWYGEKTAKEHLVNENFEENILNNPNWLKKYKLNRKLVDPFKVPKYIKKGILNNFINTPTNNNGNYDEFKKFLIECQVTNASIICDNFFPSHLQVVEW